jgi:hypothetical protein
LSRSDAAFGNNHVFNETVFDDSRQWWTEDIVTAGMLANSKIFRQVQSRSMNPNYTFSASTEEFSLGEVIAPIIAFGSIEDATVKRTLMEYFFGESKRVRFRVFGVGRRACANSTEENERLPTELGWSKKEDEITIMEIVGLTGVMRKATNLLTGGNATESSSHGKRDLHSGLPV